MRLNYFSQPAADLDDHELQALIAAGVVPPGCLNGGLVARREHNEGRNPCLACEGPRERCGGTPRPNNEKKLAPMPDAGDGPEARRLRRLEHREAILGIMREKGWMT